MSTQTAYDAESFERRAQIEYDKTRAEIQHMLEEQKRWIAEHERRLEQMRIEREHKAAERERWVTEQEKMRAQAAEAGAKTKWYPIWVTAAIASAMAALLIAFGARLSSSGNGQRAERLAEPPPAHTHADSGR